MPFSSVQFSARFMGSSAEGSKKAVKYEMYLPPETINALDQGDNKIELELIAIATGAKDAKVDTVTETVGKSLPPETVAAIHKQGLAYNNVLKLAPGEYKVHFIVRNVTTNVVGSVIAPLKVE